jgi:multidrug resistance efflux pump
VKSTVRATPPTPQHSETASGWQIGTPQPFQYSADDLPQIAGSAIPSHGPAQRAVSLTLLTVMLVALALGIAAFTVEMNLTVSANGVIEQRDVWPVRALEAGLISRIFVRTGDTVTLGEKVAELDPTLFVTTLRGLQFTAALDSTELRSARMSSVFAVQLQEARVRAAEAGALRARAAYREQLIQFSTSANVDSLERAYAPGTGTRLDIALAELRGAGAALKEAQVTRDLLHFESTDFRKRELALARSQSEIMLAKEQLRRLTILAPSDGIILTNDVHRKIGAQVLAGEQVLEVADLAAWRAFVFVEDRDVHQVRVGQPATIQLPALRQFDGKSIRAKVVAVSPQRAGAAFGSTDSPDPLPGTYRVTLEVNAGAMTEVDRAQLRRGYAVRARIVTKRDKLLSLALTYLRDRVDHAP